MSENSDDYPGAHVVATFVRALETEQRVSPATVRNYGQALRDFCRWAHGNNGFGGDFAKLTRRALRDFIVEKQHTHSRVTLHLHLAALRALYRHLLRNKQVETSPLTGLRAPKLRKKIPRFFTETQMTALLSEPDRMRTSGRIGTWESLRDQAILECLYGAGLRISELCGLDYADVDSASGLVRVLGKGRKERLVPLGEVAQNILRRLHTYGALTRETQAPEDADAIFLTDEKHGKRIYPRLVQLMLKKYLRAANLPPDFTPHKLRHTCATHLMNHGADLRMIQEQLGHASLSSTQVYTHVSLARLKQAHAVHPRA